jgi:TBC1 domain family member 15
MDLVQILTRAESLFRRFERTVQAVDKKNNFPVPQIRQRTSIQIANDDNRSSLTPASSTSPPRNSNVAASSSGINSNRNTNHARRVSADRNQSTEKVISPELRQLLSRKVVKLQRHGVSEPSAGAEIHRPAG